MKKFAIFLISATLLICSINLNAQTDGCKFRFVLKDPAGFGWFAEANITVTVDGVEYGSVTLPWGTASAEETLLLPSGEVHFLWPDGVLFKPNRNYFEIYNSLDEQIYTSPDTLGLRELFFTYQNDCKVSIKGYVSALYIYPNPANNIVNISSDNIENIQVFNSNGQLVNNYYRINSINVSSYKKGIYIFNVITLEGNNKAFKILITN